MDPNLDPSIAQWQPPAPQQVNPQLPGPTPIQGAYNPQAQGAFDPSTVQAMLALHGQANQQANIARQRKLADQLRADGGSLMEGKKVGRVYVGPKWYDAAAKLGKDWEASMEDRDAQEKSAKLDTTYQKTMGDILRQYNAKANGGM